MHKYRMEFILNVNSVSRKTIKNSIIEFGDSIEISQLSKGYTGKNCDLKIHVLTEDPTIIFDTCAQFGRIKSVKVKEAHPS